jgi:hypothetical protein
MNATMNVSMTASIRSRRHSLHVAVVALALVLGGGLSACSRAHLTPSHGRAYHAAFRVQDANPNRKAAQSVNGLDANEAAIIAGSYRKALAPKAEGGTEGQQRLLMVSPQRPVGDASGLPSSVPSGN